MSTPQVLTMMPRMVMIIKMEVMTVVGMMVMTTRGLSLSFSVK